MTTMFKISDFNRLNNNDKLKVYIKTKFVCGCCKKYYDIHFRILQRHWYNPKKYNYYSIEKKHHSKKKYFEFS